jgi:hypothetical protein
MERTQKSRVEEREILVEGVIGRQVSDKFN